MGESGSGKATLARTLLGLVAPDPRGLATPNDVALAGLVGQRGAAQVRTLQIVFQNPDSALNRAHSVRRIAGRALFNLAGVRGAAAEARLLELTRSVRLADHFLAARPRQLSGGPRCVRRPAACSTPAAPQDRPGARAGGAAIAAARRGHGVRCHLPVGELGRVIRSEAPPPASWMTASYVDKVLDYVYSFCRSRVRREAKKALLTGKGVKLMLYDRIVRVSVGKTNHNPCDLMDVARRQLDHLGPIGIRAKRGQTNERFLEEKVLDFTLPSRAMRDRYVERVETYCHPAVKVGLFRKRRAR